jgi:hypothetical protein
MPINYDDAVNYNGREIADGDFSREMIVRLVEAWQVSNKLTVDGKCGSTTQASILATIPPPAVVSGGWAPWDGPLAKQPANRTEVYAMFGTPGDEKSEWARQNIIEVQGVKAWPGVPGKWYVKIHKDVEPYAREGLRRAAASSPYVIERCGGYVYRFAQFNPKFGLSYHASGLALDFDDNRNGARRIAPKDLPKPWSPEWMKIWPKGVDEQFVLAMASCGWHWGGYWNLPGRDGLVFVDNMHFDWVGKYPV